MEMMIDRNADAAEKYELKSDGIVAEIEDKLFMIVTYGPESRYYLADIHAGRIVAAISMFEGCKCVLAYDETYVHRWTTCSMTTLLNSDYNFA